jgi:hypothetical protein
MILNDDAFARIVAEDVKNTASTEQKAYLRAPDVAERWREALGYLLDNLDGQIGGINDEEATELEAVKGNDRIVFELKEKFEFRRSKIVRFRFHVEQRLAEADRAILLAENGGKEITVDSFLRKAIEMHHDMMVDFDMDPNAIDESLYEAVKGRWTFGDIDPNDFE